MFALVEGTVKIGDVIEYGVLLPQALVIDLTDMGITILTGDFHIEQLNFAEGYWIHKVGYEPIRANWENRHTGKDQMATVSQKDVAVAHRSTNGLRVAVIDIEGSTEVPFTS